MKTVTDQLFDKVNEWKKFSSRMVRWSLKMEEYNVDIEQVADALYRNPQECIEVVEEIKVCVLSPLVLKLREEVIRW